jgi:hypothetical protein
VGWCRAAPGGKLERATATATATAATTATRGRDIGDRRRRKAQVYMLAGRLRGIALGPAEEYLAQIRSAYRTYEFDERALASAGMAARRRQRRTK